MRFSIIVPVFNKEKYLRTCIESLQKQIYKDFEVVLVDDGSTDLSPTICDEISNRDNRFKTIHKNNEGLISARRVGMANATGDYILNCDADDLLEINALEYIEKIVQNYCPDVVAFNAYMVNEHKSKTNFSARVFNDGLVNKKSFIEKMFSSYALNSMCMKAIRREVLDLDTDYSTFYRCNYGEDLLQSLPVILASKKIYYTGEQLYDYRMSSGMMRKYAKNYYESYKAVNSNIRKQLLKAGINGAECYADQHLLNSAYGAIVQAQFSNSIPLEDWKKIRQDPCFQNAYNNKDARKHITIKENIILFFFYCRLYRLLFSLVVKKRPRHSGRNEK